MNSIKLNVSGKNVTLNLPTSVTEISKVYLDEVTKPEYSLVAIVFKSSLPMLLNSNKGKEENTSVVPLFVKAGETDSDFIKGINTKDILVITGSNISLGIHINNPFNQLSLSKLTPASSEKSRKDSSIKIFIFFFFVHFNSSCISKPLK